LTSIFANLFILNNLSFWQIWQENCSKTLKKRMSQIKGKKIIIVDDGLTIQKTLLIINLIKKNKEVYNEKP